jgi:Ca2+-binding RTX toxin-like protein
LSGDKGNDRLIVKDGGNILTGGAGRDTFEFVFSEDLPETINVITDFQLDEDTIVIKGVGEQKDINYDSATGIISLNNQDILQLDSGLNIDINDLEFI